jgi:hypothetical protein
MFELTDAQASQVTSGSAGYKPAEYEAALNSILENGVGVGGCEERFPLVKPAHVAHVFRNILKKDENDEWIVARHPEFGVCVKPVN